MNSDFERIKRAKCRLYINKNFHNKELVQALIAGEEALQGCYKLTTVPAAVFSRIYKLNATFDGVETCLYCKQYLPRSVWDSIKHSVRASRGKRAFRASLMLQREGFGTATIVGLLERQVGVLRTDDLLITKEIEGAKPSSDLLKGVCGNPIRSSTARKRRFIESFGEVVGKMHAAGIFHGDLRSHNILVRQQNTSWEFFLIDNERTKKFRWLPFRLRLKNLVQINMYREGITNADRIRFFNKYWAERGKSKKAARALIEEVLEGTRWRLSSNYERTKRMKKCLRTGKKYLRIRTGNHIAVFDRAFCGNGGPVRFIERIDALMHEGQILKGGNTSCVSRLTWDGKDVVVKRYNHRGLIHSLRHTIKRSRARRNWLYAHRLGVLDVATPRPLAYIEQHRGMLLWKSYIVTEYVEGQRLYDILQDSDVTQEERCAVTQHVRDVLDELGKHRITHGDPKHTNILITETGPVLTDLDAMRAHKLNWTYRIRQAKDRARFLRKIDAGIRKFGVDNADIYWRRRKNEGRIIEKRLHRFLSDLVDEIAPKNNAKVLDCGTGPGHVFRLCTQKHETYGIELSAEAIGMYEFPTHNIKQADLNDGIPDFGVKFDVIIGSMILHWLDDPLEFLGQAKAKLAQGGRLLVVIPNITFYRYRIAYLFGKFPPISLSHKNFQVAAEAEQMFQKAHFSIERRLSPRKTIRAKLLPTLFSTDIVYVLKPI